MDRSCVNGRNSLKNLTPHSMGLLRREIEILQELIGLPDDIRMIAVDRFCDKVIRRNRRKHPRITRIVTVREKLEDFGRSICATKSLALAKP